MKDTIQREQTSTWEKLEEYVDEMGGSQGRCKKHNTNLEEEDVDPVDTFFFGDDDYQSDCPWKNSGDNRGDEDIIEWDETDSHGEILRMNQVSWIVKRLVFEGV